MTARAVIFGCGGMEVAPDERRFFAEAQPWGFIVFARNIASPAQLFKLTEALRDAVGRDAPVLVDQEGGRVARMRAPNWREWLPALEECGRLPDTALRARAMYLRYRLIGAELRAVGIDVNAAPVLDVARPDTHAVIFNRCYSHDPSEVSVIGRAVAEGLLASGVLPIAKHVPGHGRATLDSHLELPRVTASAAALEADFGPFHALADLPMAMTAHVVYEALDPEAPATQSRRMVRIIRETIGFDGLLMTDDLSMQALKGDPGARARQAFSAGCDIVLHCNADPREMAQVADVVPELEGRRLERSEAALARRSAAVGEPAFAAEAEYAALRAMTHA
jgi:beta-N-acetylhexosaminidase